MVYPMSRLGNIDQSMIGNCINSTCLLRIFRKAVQPSKQQGRALDLAPYFLRFFHVKGIQREGSHEIVKFPHIPNLDERYLITTLETPASQVNPPDGFLRSLAASPNLRLHLGGDTLTISYADSNSSTPDEEKVKLLYKI